jgi:hypothetical protein
MSNNIALLSIPLSSKAYVAKDGQVCPFCLYKNMRVTSPAETDGNNAWQNVKCMGCGKEWRDVFQLVGYEQS